MDDAQGGERAASRHSPALLLGGLGLFSSSESTEDAGLTNTESLGWKSRASFSTLPASLCFAVCPQLGQRAACRGLGPGAVPRLQRCCPPDPSLRVSPALPLVWAMTPHGERLPLLRQDSSPGSAGLLLARRRGSPGRVASELDAHPLPPGPLVPGGRRSGALRQLPGDLSWSW